MTEPRYLKHNPKVVALVGMGPSVTDLFNETLTQECSPRWCDEVWAINMVANAVRHDMVIWMDDLHEQQNFKPGLFEMLRRYNTPVLTSKAYPDIVPNSYDYPISEIAQMSIPYFGKPYLTNGVAMGIAYALYKGVRVLRIYGCDFTYPNRNFAEEGRACVEAWIALASMKGMNIMLAPNTSLMDTVADHGIYGYAEQPEIDMPDGTKMKYVQPGSGVGKYVATDGEPNGELRPEQPGTGSIAPAINGGAANPEHAAPAPQAEPAPQPGAGIRPEGGHELAQTAAPPGHGGSGANGHFQDEAEASILSV